MFEEIKEEIRKKGLFEAITVRKLGDEFEILDGYHRWVACKELGYTEIRVNNLGEIDDKLARAITVIKEQKKVPLSELKVSELVGWFREQDIEKGDIMDLMGYSEEQYNEYEKMFDFDWSEYKVDFTDEGGNDIDKEEQEVVSTIRTLKFRLDKERYDRLEQKIDEQGKNKFIDWLTE